MMKISLSELELEILKKLFEFHADESKHLRDLCLEANDYEEALACHEIYELFCKMNTYISMVAGHNDE